MFVILRAGDSNYSVIAPRDPVGDGDVSRRRALQTKLDLSHASQLL